MAKHISQKGPFHYTYLRKVQNDNTCISCGAYSPNGICKIDNQKCMADNYCKYYDINLAFENYQNTDYKILIFELEINENNTNEIHKIYISDTIKTNQFTRISTDTQLAKQLKKHHKIGEVFAINKTNYKILSITIGIAE